MIYYPWTNRTVQENDLVWVYDGQRLVRVVKIVETEKEMRQVGVNDRGFCFSYEAGECQHDGYDGFMPQREMKRDMNYPATDREKWGMRLLLHRLASKYDLKEEQKRFAISYRISSDEADDTWLTWDIVIWTEENKTRCFLYDEKEDLFHEKTE